MPTQRTHNVKSSFSHSSYEIES